MVLGLLRRLWLPESCADADCAADHPLGPDASSDMLRRSARCSKCGAKGATLTLPSWVSTNSRLRPVSGQTNPAARAMTSE
jgi:hypothetical protein